MNKKLKLIESHLNQNNDSSTILYFLLLNQSNDSSRYDVYILFDNVGLSSNNDYKSVHNHNY